MSASKFIEEEFDSMILLENTITEYFRPTVIDSGMSFTDSFGRTHTNACGWLSVHAALHFKYAMGGLPTRLHNLLTCGGISPERLKLVSKCDNINARIDEYNQFTPIAHWLGVSIIVWIQGDPHIYGDYTTSIHIWLTSGHHTAYVNPMCQQPNAEVFAKKFANKFPMFGYTAHTMEPLSVYIYNMHDEIDLINNDLFLTYVNIYIDRMQNIRREIQRIRNTHGSVSSQLGNIINIVETNLKVGTKRLVSPATCDDQTVIDILSE